MSLPLMQSGFDALKLAQPLPIIVHETGLVRAGLPRIEEGRLSMVKRLDRCRIDAAVEERKSFRQSPVERGKLSVAADSACNLTDRPTAFKARSHPGSDFRLGHTRRRIRTALPPWLGSDVLPFRLVVGLGRTELRLGQSVLAALALQDSPYRHRRRHRRGLLGSSCRHVEKPGSTSTEAGSPVFPRRREPVHR